MMREKTDITKEMTMNKLFIIAIALFSIAAQSAQVNQHRWVINDVGLAAVLASSHDDKVLVAQKCYGKLAFSMYDFANYNQEIQGRIISFKWRVDKNAIYEERLKVLANDDGTHGLLLQVNDEQTKTIINGDKLRMVFLSEGEYKNMETYTLTGLKYIFTRAKDDCTNEFFNSASESYF